MQTTHRAAFCQPNPAHLWMFVKDTFVESCSVSMVTGGDACSFQSRLGTLRYIENLDQCRQGLHSHLKRSCLHTSSPPCCSTIANIDTTRLPLCWTKHGSSRGGLLCQETEHQLSLYQQCSCSGVQEFADKLAASGASLENTKFQAAIKLAAASTASLGRLC